MSDADSSHDPCAICLSTIDCAASEVVLVCKHTFHGQCVARHLQLDRRCPVCRQAPQTAIQENDDDSGSECSERSDDMLDDADHQDFFKTIALRLGKEHSAPELEALILKYDPEARLSGASKTELEERAAEQLMYETETEDEDED